jgi:hypothetical protein
VDERHALNKQVNAVQRVAARHLALRFYEAWRKRFIMQRRLTAQSQTFLHTRVHRRMQSAVLSHWRTHLRFERTGQAIQAVGASFERDVTQPRQVHARFRQWHDVAVYHAQVQASNSALLARRTHRTSNKIFRVWHALSRRHVALKCMERRKRLYAGRDAFDAWRAEARLLKTADAVARISGFYAQRAALTHWRSRLLIAQSDRADVQQMQVRLQAAGQRANRRWVNARPWLLSVLKTWMAPESSLKFYMRIWRTYNKQCRSFRDAYDRAEVHYERHVLTPAAWREWHRACVVSRTERAARACLLRHARQRFLARLRDMLHRRDIRAQQKRLADVHHEETVVTREWRHWKELTRMQQQNRVRAQ